MHRDTCRSPGSGTGDGVRWKEGQGLSSYAAIAPNASWSNSSSVAKYAARYYELLLSQDLEDLQITVTGATTGDYSFHFIGIKGTSSASIVDVTTGTKYTYTKKLTKGQWTRSV